MHLFVTGAVGAGKSTLLRALLEQEHRPLYGFATHKGEESPQGLQILLSPAAGGAGRVIAVCRSESSFWVDVAALNGFGVDLLKGIPDGALVLMDELGFFESKAEAFCQQVLKTLDRNVTILGAIKPLPLPFLDSVRQHPKVRTVKVTPSTRKRAQAQAEALFFGKGARPR